MGVSLIAMNHTHEAAKVLRKGSRLEGKGLRDRPAHENARMASLLQLGGLYTQHGKVKSALAVYREALHSHPPRYPLQVSHYIVLISFPCVASWQIINFASSPGMSVV